MSEQQLSGERIDWSQALTVEAKGAYIAELRDNDGEPIFLPKQTVMINGEPKLRGGCHPCWPNFGPGGESGLPQHGPARTSEWAQESTADGVIERINGSMMPGYEAIDATIRYTWQPTAFTTTLTTVNRGDHEVRVAPAFHPYFDAPTDAVITLDGQPIDRAQCHDAWSIDGSNHTLAINGKTLQLTSEGCHAWTVWSDESAGFICVEPTRCGPSFSRHSEPLPEEILAPGAEQVISYTVAWGEDSHS